MAKKNSSAPSSYNPNYGSSGKSTSKPPAYQLGTDNWTNANRGSGLGYQVGTSGGKNTAAPPQATQQAMQSELARLSAMAAPRQVDQAAVAANQAVPIGIGPAAAGTEGGGEYGLIGSYTRPGYDANGNFLGELGAGTGHRQLPDGSYEVINTPSPIASKEGMTDAKQGLMGMGRRRPHPGMVQWQEMVNALRGMQ